MLNKVLSGVMSGILISIGGIAFLKSDNKYIGAILFTVALLCICYQGYSLFTGKVCYIPEKLNKEFLSIVFLGLFGNIVGTVICGLIMRFTDSSLFEVAKTLCDSKLTQNWYQTIIKGIFCGILIYLAVDIYTKKSSALGIIFCIPVFVLCGFEHSIADMFYFACAGSLSVNVIIFILLVIIGNSVGGMLLPLLTYKEKGNLNAK